MFLRASSSGASSSGASSRGAEPHDAGEDPRFLSEQILTYLGNKRSLLDFIGVALGRVKAGLGKDKLRCFDVFSGSGIVSRYLKQHASVLFSGDLEPYCQTVNRCYLANAADVDPGALRAAIEEVNRAGKTLTPGFIAELYAPRDDEHIQPGERVFYTRRNACFLDSARRAIDGLNPSLRDFVLAPLLYEASVHANTSGVFKGFYKNSETGVGQFGGNGRDALGRILRDIVIPMPVFSRFACDVVLLQGDANEYASGPRDLDLAYLDPPYNQHPYGSNYFMLNLLVDYRRPASLSRVSGIPPGWRRSRYNRRRESRAAFTELVESIDARFLLISFNSEGFISTGEMLSMLKGLGRVEALQTRYNTFRGSRNLRNRSLHVTEYLYLVERR